MQSMVEVAAFLAATDASIPPTCRATVQPRPRTAPPLQCRAVNFPRVLHVHIVEDLRSVGVVAISISLPYENHSVGREKSSE